MKKIFLFILIPCLLINTGCWNRREFNELSLVVGIAIDKTDDNQFLVTVQIVDPGEIAFKGGGGRTPVTTYTQKGKTLFETVRRMTTIAPRKLYFSHLQMVILSEKIAKDGINHALEFFTRDPEFRKDFYIAIARDIKATEIMKNLTSIEKIPSNKLHSSLDASEKAWAPTVATRMDELLLQLTSDGNNPVLTGITIRGSKVNHGHSMKNLETISNIARLQYQGIAVFNKDKLVGWLNEKQSKGYNYINDNITNTVGAVPCSKNEDLVVEYIRSHTDVKGKIENGKPKIEINIKTEGNIAEVACGVDLTNLKAIRKLEEATEKVNLDIVKSALKKAKELGVDIFGFGEAIHRADPKSWGSLKKNWNQEFVNMPVSVTSDFKFRRTGTVNQSFLKAAKE